MLRLLKSLLPRIKSYSKDIEESGLLLNKPWALVSETDSFQKFIFKANNQLILSKDGDVSIGKWEFFSDANALLIEQDDSKGLYTRDYMDEALCILHKDGKNDAFFILVNEAIIKDLNFMDYLINRFPGFVTSEGDIASDRPESSQPNPEKKEKQRSKEAPIADKDKHFCELVLRDEIIVSIKFLSKNTELIGAKAFCNGQIVQDGIYTDLNTQFAYEIMNGIVLHKYWVRHYVLTGNREITIYQRNGLEYNVGDMVKVNGETPEDGHYRLKMSLRLRVVWGRIFGISVF
jgi:hypothetical protein